MLCLACIIPFWAQSNPESYNIVSDNYSNKIENVKVVRNINGGTVIIPEFDETCPEELKAPFMYACKIVEEYMPPSLPIKIKVSVGELTAQYGKSISKVQPNLKDDFGYSPNKSVTTSQIKGVIVGEMGTNANNTFRPYVPNVSFLTDLVDIEITYNELFIPEISFSLEANPNDKYDFISVVLRDILKGLGLSSSFRYSEITKEFTEPRRPLTDFEIKINEALGENNSTPIKLINATKGKLEIPKNRVKKLQLYAPQTWQNQISLNYFIPQEGCDVSNILMPEFCKGMVCRSLSDDYSQLIFRELLGWIPDEISGVSGEGSEYSSNGTTSSLMPYNGSISFTFSPLSANSYSNAKDFNEQPIISTNAFIEENESSELRKYFNSFHPFFLGDTEVCPEIGTSISILKKDGTWDLMELKGGGPRNIYNMADWAFHYDESEYARTIDGYLRGRITYKSKDSYYGTTKYQSIYFVLDYIPQKVNLSCKLLENTIATSNDQINLVPTQVPVRIFFSNTEGIEKIVLERLKEGSRIPNRITITNLKDGYYDTTIEKATTFTAVAYNKNGSSRGLPITVVPNPTSPSNDIVIKVDNNRIQLKLYDQENSTFTYQIRNLTFSTTPTIINGSTDRFIDISHLENGDYIVSATSVFSKASGTLKFRK